MEVTRGQGGTTGLTPVSGSHHAMRTVFMSLEVSYLACPTFKGRGIFGHISKPPLESRIKSTPIHVRARGEAGGDCETKSSRNSHKPKGTLQTLAGPRIGRAPFSLPTHLAGREAGQYFSYIVNFLMLSNVLMKCNPFLLVLMNYGNIPSVSLFPCIPILNPTPQKSGTYIGIREHVLCSPGEIRHISVGKGTLKGAFARLGPCSGF